MTEPPLRLSRRRVVATLGAGLCAPAARAAAGRDPSHDFDFLFGSWSVKHRRRQAFLAGDERWAEFPGTLKVRPILGGGGNIDENVLEAPAGRYLASSLRLFDPKAQTWSLYWIDGRAPHVDAPLVGRFEGRIGRFYNDDTFEGRPIKVRFTYETLDPRHARWDQAFSADAGATWETNWTMAFSRTAD